MDGNKMKNANHHTRYIPTPSCQLCFQLCSLWGRPPQSQLRHCGFSAVPQIPYTSYFGTSFPLSKCVVTSTFDSLVQVLFLATITIMNIK